VEGQLQVFGSLVYSIS